MSSVTMRIPGNRAALGRAGAAQVRRRAERYARDPGRLADLLGRAQRKAEKREGPLAGIREELMLLLRMLGAYLSGSYRVVPWQSLLLVVGAVLYFVVPTDLIPDALLGPGLLDDAAVIAWTVRAISADLEAFRKWERQAGTGDVGSGHGEVAG